MPCPDPMEAGGVAYPYDIEGIRGVFVERKMRVAEQIEVVELLMEECVDYEFLERLVELHGRLLDALERVQTMKERRKKVMEKFTAESQKGRKVASKRAEERVFRPERIVLDHVPGDEDRRRIGITARWLRESGMMECGDERQLASLLGAYPMMPITEPIVCRKPANMLGYLLMQLQPLLWGRNEGMNTVASDISHAVCTVVVQADGSSYNESSVRTSARQVNIDVQEYFRPLIELLRT